VVCLHAAPQVQLFASTYSGWHWLHNAHSIISSCQSAATSEIVKRSWLLSMCSSWSSAISSRNVVLSLGTWSLVVLKDKTGVFGPGLGLESLIRFQWNDVSGCFLPQTIKIYLNLLQLCIVNHRRFFPGHGVEELPVSNLAYLLPHMFTYLTFLIHDTYV